MFTLHLKDRQIGTCDNLLRCFELASIHNTTLDIREPGGRIVGHVSPPEPQPDAPVPWMPWITKEELERQHAESTWTTFDKIKAKLEGA